jgi:hypothetical protein
MKADVAALGNRFAVLSMSLIRGLVTIIQNPFRSVAARQLPAQNTGQADITFFSIPSFLSKAALAGNSKIPMQPAHQTLNELFLNNHPVSGVCSNLCT